MGLKENLAAATAALNYVQELNIRSFTKFRDRLAEEGGIEKVIERRQPSRLRDYGILRAKLSLDRISSHGDRTNKAPFASGAQVARLAPRGWVPVVGIEIVAQSTISLRRLERRSDGCEGRWHDTASGVARWEDGQST